jgi:hypothetical protein
MRGPSATTDWVELEGIGRGVRVANAGFELLVSVALGPRVLRYAAVSGPNAFGEVPRDKPQATTPLGEWYAYGGHRLWLAPEDPVRSYAPDNDAVQAEPIDSGVIVTRRAEPPFAIEKSMRITLDARSSRVVVEHRLANRGDTPTPVAPWAITIMAPGGESLFPNAPFVPHPLGLLPARALVLWPYTSLGDPRFRFGPKILRLRHARDAAAPQKIGTFVEQGWAAYATRDQLFVKRFPAAPEPHPDMGCNAESFTDRAILELESLGPLVTLARGEQIVHVERWELFPGVSIPQADDEAMLILTPLVASLA